MRRKRPKLSEELELVKQSPSNLRYLALVAIVAIVALMYMVANNAPNLITVDTKHMEEVDIAGQAYTAVCEYDTDCNYGEECLDGECVVLEE